MLLRFPPRESKGRSTPSMHFGQAVANYRVNALRGGYTGRSALVNVVGRVKASRPCRVDEFLEQCVICILDLSSLTGVSRWDQVYTEKSISEEWVSHNISSIVLNFASGG